MIWFFKRHLYTYHEYVCIYRYIAYHEYCMLRIHMCDCVFLCSLLKSSGVGTEFIQLCMFAWFGWKVFWYPNVHGAPALEQQILDLDVLETIKDSASNIHPSSTFWVQQGGLQSCLTWCILPWRRISLATGTLFGPKQSKWQQLWTENIHLIDDLLKDLFSPYSTKQFHETRMTTPRNMLYRNGFGMSHVSWYIFLNNRRLEQKNTSSRLLI